MSLTLSRQHSNTLIITGDQIPPDIFLYETKSNILLIKQYLRNIKVVNITKLTF